MFTRKHELRLESLEQRYLLTTMMDYSTYLAERGALDITTEQVGQDTYVYALLGGAENVVVKLKPKLDSNSYTDCGPDPREQICWEKMLTGPPVGGAIAVHNNSVYVTGQAWDGFEAIVAEAVANNSGFQPFQSQSTGGRDAFVVQLSKDDSTVEYATYLAGDQGDAGRGIAVDDSGAIYVSGTTGADGTFPVTDGSVAGSLNEGFVAKLIPDTTLAPTAQLEYSTLLTGGADDFAEDLELTDCDPITKDNCSVVVAGRTSSADFAGLSPTHNGGEDAFAVKVTPGTGVVSGTFLGGASDDQASAVVTGPGGGVFVTGATDSADFPAPDGPAPSGNTDAFLTRLSSDLSSVNYSTLVGGSGEDTSRDVAVDNDIAYITGQTKSTDFPVMDPIDDSGIPYSGDSRNGKSDAYVARIDTSPNGDGLTHSTYLGGSKDENGGSIVLTGSDAVWVGGATNSSDFPLTSNALDPDHEGPGGPEQGYDPFLTKLSFPAPTPGITINPTSGLTTTEGGGTTEFTVVLDTQPTANVTIGISSDDISEGTVNQASLIFTPANYSTAQTVTVFGEDDSDLDGDVGYTIITAQAVSGDPDYNGLKPDDVSVTNVDDESPSLEPLHVGALSSTGSTVSKGKWTASVTITVHGPTHGAISGATVSGYWSNGATGSSDCITTGTSGECTVTRNNIKANTASVTFTVEDVSGEGHSYDPQANEVDPASIDVFPGGTQPLVVDAIGTMLTGQLLTEELLSPTVNEAVDLWAAAGVESQRLAELNQVDVHIADLDNELLGSVSPGTLLVDRDAAGHGWAIDPVASQSQQLDGVDLLSTLVHELGHVLGFDHDVMGATLGVGERDLSYLDDLFADTSSWEQAFEPGDANGDGRFDQLDLVAVLQADKYRTGQAADWSQGDWDGNGVFDQLDVIEALQSGRYAPSAEADELLARI